MLEPETWLAQAQELAPGQSRRVDHVCGKGRTLRIDNKQEGYSAWCWRCNDKGWHPHPQPSLAERIARLKEKHDTDAAAIADSRPPTPIDFEPAGWPLHARVWLYRAGLGNDEIRQAGIYYCQRLDRVVLPVCIGGRLVYWQARGFDRDRAKYINPPIDKTGLAATYGSKGPVIVVEDILSAIKVGMVARGWSILGTAVSDAQAAAIAKAADGGGVGIWLDPDKAGRTARAKVRRTLSLHGIDARIIRTDLDPKLYSREEIRRIVFEE